LLTPVVLGHQGEVMRPSLRIAVLILSLVGAPSALAPADDAPASANGWQPPVPAREWRFILVHHSATEAGSVEGIDAVHRQRLDANGNPWRGIGYHFVIGNGHGMEDGAVESTFRWQEQLAGAHAGIWEYNSQGIGICLIGNFEETPPTEAQLAAMYALIDWLKTEYSLPADALIRHQDVRATACPGRLFPWDEASERWSESEAILP
jgi:hypothetical protein